MTVNKRSVPLNSRAAELLQGGRWVAFSGFAYVVAWLIGLAIGLATSAPGPTDTVLAMGAYFSSHREMAMIQAYLLVGIAGVSLIVFAATLYSALRTIMPLRFQTKFDRLVRCKMRHAEKDTEAV